MDSNDRSEPPFTLPLDAIERIMVCLPPDYLPVCRHVSKEWMGIVDSIAKRGSDPFGKIAHTAMWASRWALENGHLKLFYWIVDQKRTIVERMCADKRAVLAFHSTTSPPPPSWDICFQPESPEWVRERQLRGLQKAWHAILMQAAIDGEHIHVLEALWNPSPDSFTSVIRGAFGFHITCMMMDMAMQSRKRKAAEWILLRLVEGCKDPIQTTENYAPTMGVDRIEDVPLYHCFFPHCAFAHSRDGKGAHSCEIPSYRYSMRQGMTPRFLRWARLWKKYENPEEFVENVMESVIAFGVADLVPILLADMTHHAEEASRVADQENLSMGKGGKAKVPDLWEGLTDLETMQRELALDIIQSFSGSLEQRIHVMGSYEDRAKAILKLTKAVDENGIQANDVVLNYSPHIDAITGVGMSRSDFDEGFVEDRLRTDILARVVRAGIMDQAMGPPRRGMAVIRPTPPRRGALVTPTRADVTMTEDDQEEDEAEWERRRQWRCRTFASLRHNADSRIHPSPWAHHSNGSGRWTHPADKNLCLTPLQLCYLAAFRRGDYGMAEWLCSACQIPLGSTLAVVCSADGNMRALWWLAAHRCPFRFDCFLAALDRGRLDVIQWLFDSGFPTPPTTSPSGPVLVHIMHHSRDTTETGWSPKARFMREGLCGLWVFQPYCGLEAPQIVSWTTLTPEWIRRVRAYRKWTQRTDRTRRVIISGRLGMGDGIPRVHKQWVTEMMDMGDVILPISPPFSVDA